MKSVASRPARRRLAAGALALTAVLGATGCSAVSPVATGIQYSASDGVNATQTGFVEVRNLGMVGEGASGPARLIGSLKNDSGADKTYTIAVQDGGQVTVPVKAGETVKLEEQQLEVERSVWPGQNAQATVSADGTQLQLGVPVLSATQEQYKEYLPTGQSADTEHLDEQTATYGEGEGEQH
ncbi:hypothetical protein [Micrococcus porci]|uniref:hypothetical protein n=1 Tax=Micrococcus porci TaxID=2856555 RepID=UPI003CF67212